MNELTSSRSPRLRGGPVELGSFYQTIFTIPDFAVYIIRVERDGSFLFEDANETVAQLADRPLYDILGCRPDECMPPELAECLETNLRLCLESGKTHNYERSLEINNATLSWRTTLTPVAVDGGRATHVIGFTRDVSFEKKMVSLAAHRAALLQGLGATLPSALYLFNVKTRSIRFISTQANAERDEWRKSAEDAGARSTEMFAHPDDRPKLYSRLDELTHLENGEIATVTARILTREGIYRPHLFRETVFSRGADGLVEVVIGVCDDISEHERHEEEIRTLSDRLLTLQMDERRRIAEDLHDSTAQHLTAAGLAVSRLSPLGKRNAMVREALADARSSLDEATREIRVMSYLLHPPLIETQGLGDAIRTFSVGFGARAGLAMNVTVDPRAREVGDGNALHLFRICQEALANVHRHARATEVSVTLDVDNDAAILKVSDNGIGFDPEELEARVQSGVGLRGMRERMKRLGGSLQFVSRTPGTLLVANIPCSGETAG